jgi:sucrose phosphorylase
MMADLVLNHVSIQSPWFQRFIEGDPAYQNFFTSFTRDELTDDVVKDLQKVFRPRALPLLTEFETKHGKRFVWTTISKDQVDLNYQNPQVLLEMIKVILLLLEKGIRVFRMDAITFIWKELGTNCVHLPQGHAILQIFREVLNQVCPSAILVTETNVPHKDNISYFGNGKDEAQMVYNFALPPLTLHAFYTANTDYLTEWAKTLTLPSKDTTFFNFLACHDGIGIMGAKGILPEEEISKIFQHITDNGAKLSYRRLPSGEVSVYEMCSTWWSALNKKDEDFTIALRKFITSHAIAFALAGIPAVYYLSFFGKENDTKTWEITQINRNINRENLDYKIIKQQLSHHESKELIVYQTLIKLIKQRTSHSAFHPNAPQTVLSLDKKVFALLRESREENILALHNVSGEEVTVSYRDKRYTLEPYGFLWDPTLLISKNTPSY